MPRGSANRGHASTTLEQLEADTRVRLSRPARCGGVLYPAGSSGKLVVEGDTFGLRFERGVVDGPLCVTIYWTAAPRLGVDLELANGSPRRTTVPPIDESRVQITYPVPPKRLRRPPVASHH